MKTLTRELKTLPKIKEAFDQLHTKKAAYSITGCTDSSKLHLMSCLGEGFKFVLIIAPDDLRVRQIMEDYKLFDKEIIQYPAKDLMFYRADIKGYELSRERMKCLRRILENQPATIVTTFDSLMAHQTPLEVLKNNIMHISVQSTVDEKALSKKLVMMGYEKSYKVEQPGQFSVRGGIVDIFELTEENPYRIELWGDDVDSIRSFDVGSQRSIESLESIVIYPATEMILTDEEISAGISKITDEASKQAKKLRDSFLTEASHRVETDIKALREEVLEFKNLVNLDSYMDFFFEKPGTFLSLFSQDDSVIFIDEPLRVANHAESVETEFKDSMSHRMEKGYVIPGQMNILCPAEEIRAKIADFPFAMFEELKVSSPFDKLKDIESIELKVKPIQSYNNSFEALVRDITKYHEQKYKVILLSGSGTRAQRLASDLQDHDFLAFYSDNSDRELVAGEVETFHGYISKGYEFPDIKLAVISETDIFGQRQNKRKKKRYDGQSIREFTELSIGDYVVHEYHGLGIYRGIEQIVTEGITKDYIKVEYREGGNLYVLASNISVLQKYASADAKTPKLSKLGTQEWVKTKEKVKAATELVARDLVELYAKRQQIAGYRFGPDTVWQREFEEMFPFRETEDQLQAIEETKKDMESSKIMDRLICGDVGFGKTEVAIRAAFKAVQEGKQVVFLVPTTILAQQHYDTFRERMKDFPIRVDLLSRFRTTSEIKTTLSDLKKGFVDIVIGTHRVLSKDVEFKDLGLLIIDEEQRFGVSHKEKIKKLKESVDVLTLTATPIPRTLHMSLVGIRDMSVLEEAPEERQPIQTYVMEYNEEMVREAIVRELARGGQVYYVYNRVNNIAEVAAEISRLVPEARVTFAHGQMPEKDLEYVMYQFIYHEIDVLVSTTIIETGMDISNVNTMIIHDSDRLGLSQLYQLRGRVGRSNRTAYAFLMYRKDRLLKEEAEKRLSAIREFTDLGSGYKIAMKDLEIRGAGNLLGKSQHGHMQAVGYELYCKMLQEAVLNLKGIETMVDFDTLVDLEADAYIPAEYIVNEVQKLDIYKRIAAIENDAEQRDMRDELMDRFGAIPSCADNLLRIATIRARAHELFFTEVRGKNGVIVFTVKKDARLNPNGVIGLFEKYPRLSFSNKSYQFVLKYDETGFPEKDEKILLNTVEDILRSMHAFLAV